MSYYPDGDLCLIVIEMPEKVPAGATTNASLLKKWFRSEEEIKKDNERETVERRNQIRETQAKNFIQRAKRDKYKPVFFQRQKNEISVVGINKKKSWNSIKANALINFSYSDKIRNVVSNVVKQPNNRRWLGSWEELLDNYQPGRNQGGNPGGNKEDSQ